MKPIIPREAAERDADEAADYYTDEGGEELGRAFVEAVREAYDAIGDNPGAGSPRYADLLKIKDLKTKSLRRFPYLILYVERDDHIDVWRLLHAKRDIPFLLADPS